MALLPGKGGFFGILNEDIVGWLKNTLDEVRDAYEIAGGDEMHDSDPIKMLKELKGLDADWKYVKDDFGRKMYNAIPAGNGEYRVTVVLTNRNELKVDIRSWWDPENTG
jgi:hypothetical protein